MIALAKRHQMKVIERRDHAGRNADATEVFLAGTAAEVTPSARSATISFTPGTITDTLRSDYEALVQMAPDEVAKVVG